MGLQPFMLCKVSARGLYEEAVRLHAYDCIECGSCSFTCPAALPLLDYIRLGKAEAMKIVRTRKA
jgi:electron transport complex protein RnfC